MTKTPTKQYFEEVLASQQQDGYLKFVSLMPNNISTCKLIEQTLEDNGYRHILSVYKEQERYKYIKNRNEGVKIMYISIWNDNTYGYYDIRSDLLNSEYFAQYFSCAYVTSRNAVKATLQAIEALKQYNIRRNDNEQT